MCRTVTNTRIILFSILIAVLLAILVMWCAEVLAHDASNPKAHFEPYTAADPCWNDACNNSEYRGGHGHIDGYDDENGNGRWDLGEENSWGYWTCDGYKYLVPETDCSEPKSQPTLQPQPTVQPELQPRSSSTSTNEPIAVVLDRLIDDKPEPPKIETPEPPPPVPTVEKVWWHWQFWRGWNLMYFKVLPEGVETLADLYHHWAFFAAHNAHIVVNIDGEWLLYSGDGELTGEIPLSAHLGLAVRLDWAAYLGVQGVPLPSAETIDLHAGANLVGFPTLPVDVRVPSDFLADTIIAVIVARRGEFYLVGRAGDSGDEALESGAAVILIVTEPTTLHLTAQVQPNDQPGLDTDAVRGWGAEKVNGTD